METPEAEIILFARLPRTCGCIFEGAALAVSGTIIQGTLHNPLVAPNVIGVNSGAGFAVVLFSAIAPTMSPSFRLRPFLFHFVVYCWYW